MANINPNAPAPESPAIAALSTPVGKGALAIIRLTGAGVHELFAEVVYEKERFREAKARQIGVYTIVGSANAGSVDDPPCATAAGDDSGADPVADRKGILAPAVGADPDISVDDDSRSDGGDGGCDDGCGSM